MPDMGFDPTTSNLNETSVSIKLHVDFVCKYAFAMSLKLGNFRKVIKYRGISSTNLDSNLLLPLCDERAAVCRVKQSEPAQHCAAAARVSPAHLLQLAGLGMPS